MSYRKELNIMEKQVVAMASMSLRKVSNLSDDKVGKIIAEVLTRFDISEGAATFLTDWLIKNRCTYRRPINTMKVARTHLPYQVEKHLVTEWLPILGVVGFALYNFYLCLGDDEMATPGIRETANHLSISASYVNLYNRLLVYCELIKIVPGEGPKPNGYILLPIPRVTQEAMERIKRKVAKDWQMKTQPGFLRRSSKRQPVGLLDRLDSWEPIRPDDFIDEAPPENEDDKLTDRIALLRGMRRIDAQKVTASYQNESLYRWLAWFTEMDNRKPNLIGNQASYLFKALENGEEPPPLYYSVSNSKVCHLCETKLASDNLNHYCDGCLDKLGIVH